jgi:ribosomal protein S27AE
VMPQPKRFRPSNPPPAGKRRCPKCGLPMFLAKLEPAEKEGRDERTFECAQCAYGERVIVKFR